MFASQFKEILDTNFPLIAQHYMGPFEFKNYPPELSERNFILWNSADSLPGEHWRILYRSHNSVEIFDPLGLTEPEIRRWNLKFNENLLLAFNIDQIQPARSPTCGQKETA